MKTDNKRLYDLSTRIAFYIEGVKLQQGREFNYVLFDLSETFKKLLGQVQYTTLDGLSKSELNKLILTLRKSQLQIYSQYTDKLLKQLEDFTAAVLEVNRRVYASEFKFSLSNDTEEIILSDDEAEIFITEESKNNNFISLFALGSLLGKDNGIYKAGLNIPISANGFYPIPFIKTFSNSAQASTENIIRKAWVNQTNVSDTLLELLGNPSQPVGLGSQIKKIRNQAVAVIDTTMAHFANLSSVAVQSALFGRYMWVSVMDEHTSDICIERNGDIYEYGNGPVPPAHINCRSHIAPISPFD